MENTENIVKPTSIEQDIIHAAQATFLEKGYARTTTTEIAKRAGCNQSLVHYYYRTKENLFRAVFLTFVNDMLEQVFMYLTDESLSFNDKVSRTIDMYFDTLIRNPQLPFLILNELIVNPERREYIREHFIKNPNRALAYMHFCNVVNDEIRRGGIHPIEPFDLLVNIVSLTASTFLSLPLYEDLLQKKSCDIESYILHRREIVKSLIINDLKTMA